MGCIFSKGNDLKSKSSRVAPESELLEKQLLLLSKDWPLATLSKKTPNCPPLPFTTLLKQLLQWPADEEASFTVLDKVLSSSDILELQQCVAFNAADNGRLLATPASPPCYLPIGKILKQLDMLSMSCAMNILHESCGLVIPKQLHIVFELLEFICDELQTSDGATLESETLVVPDDDCRLVASNTCVYIDPRGSQYLKFIDSSTIRFVHHDVSERLCLAFGIRKLSNVVVEELDYVEPLEILEEDSLASIRLKLLSRPFQDAVSTVVNRFSRITSGFKNPDFQTLQTSLESVAKKLKLVQRIYTRFWLLPKFLDITHTSNESGSSHQALYYVDRSCTCMLISQGGSNNVSLVDLVAIVVSHVLGSPVPLPIASLFLCPHNLETDVVNTLNLSSQAGTSLLGRPLHPRDEKKVLFLTVTPYVKGEIVAWRSGKGKKLQYGRLLEDVKLQAGQDSYSFNVETSPGIIKTITSPHAFRFKNFVRELDS